MTSKVVVNFHVLFASSVNTAFERLLVLRGGHTVCGVLGYLPTQ